jgi:hypothetical protein
VDLGSYPWVVRCSPAPSVGAATGTPACSSPPAPTSTCWSSGGGKSGSVASAPGADSVGVDPSGADGSGAGAAVTGPALVDSSWDDDPGAGAVMAGSSWRFTVLAALITSSQSSYKSKQQNVYCATRCKLTVWQCGFLFDGLFHPHGPLQGFRRRWRGFTSQWRGPRHNDGDGRGG